MNFNEEPYRSLLSGLGIQPTRRRLFVSYHHQGDQAYYDALSTKLHDQLEVVFDNSLDRRIDSDNPDYVIQRIRDDFVSGTSCTVVLCGAETPQRKYVDWEIKATLDKEHGLIGLGLPTARRDEKGHVIVPDRLLSNYQSGYVVWKSWNDLVANPALITSWIEEAVARDKSKIVNPQAIMSRNR